MPGTRSPKQAAAKKVADARKESKRQADAQSLDVTDISDWKKGPDQDRTAGKLMVPSGKVCLVHVAGMESFISRGIVPNALMPIVTQAVKEGQGVSSEKAAEMTTPENIIDMMSFADNVVCDVVISPVVHTIEERQEILADEDLSSDEKAAKINSMLFVDEVDLNDKMFIFQYVVGGTRDLETFRKQQASALANVAPRKAVAKKAK